MNLIAVKNREYFPEIRKLYTEYLSWAFSNANQHWGAGYREEEVSAYIENDLKTVDRLLPPNGRLYLAEVDSNFVGVGAIKHLDDERGEIKRMYVQDRARGLGVGKAILNQLIEDGRLQEYKAIFLDSPDFCKPAHRLYEQVGFEYTEPYPGVEDPEEVHPFLKFMKLNLLKDA